MTPKAIGRLPVVLVKVNTGDEEVEFEIFNKDAPLPPYVALSLGDWKRDGVQSSKHSLDLQATDTEDAFTMACYQAEEQHYDWLWVDKLQYDWGRDNDLDENQTINSMADFYRAAKVCFVYLHDLPPDTDPTDEEAWAACSWFRSLFALSALVASKELAFFAGDGTAMGTNKSSEIAETVSSITKIAPSLMSSPSRFSSVSSFRKFALVQSRIRSKGRRSSENHHLHVLASLFGVRQPQPRPKADPFFQLQSEIVQSRAGDLSLLAWEDAELTVPSHGVFADSLDRFLALAEDTVEATHAFATDRDRRCELDWGGTWVVSAYCYSDNDDDHDEDDDEDYLIMGVGKRPGGERVGIRLCFDEEEEAFVRVPPYLLESISKEKEMKMRVLTLKTIPRPKRPHEPSPTRDMHRVKKLVGRQVPAHDTGNKASRTTLRDPGSSRSAKDARRSKK